MSLTPTRVASHRVGRSLSVLVVALLLGASVTGCGGDEVAERVAERAAERQAGGDGDVDNDGGEVTIETSEGTVTSGNTLPEGFPVDDVPLIDGTITVAMDAAGTGYQVLIQADTSADNGMAKIANQLTQAGLIEQKGLSIADIKVFESPRWTVAVSAADAPDGTVFSYLVSVAD